MYAWMLAAIACSVAMLFGPALENAVAAALSAGTVADGRVWKYFGSGVVTGLPALSSSTLPVFLLITGSVNCWPMIFDPTSLPPTNTFWPFALPGNATWLIPVITSGYRTPSNSVNTTIPIADVVMSFLMSVEVSGQALHERAQQPGGEERERADEHDHADQQHHERGVIGPHRPQAGGADPLPGQRPRDREREQDRRVPRDHHVKPTQQVGERDPVRPHVPGGRLDVAGVAGERGAVVVGLREIRVEGLRESLRLGGG